MEARGKARKEKKPFAQEEEGDAKGGGRRKKDLLPISVPGVGSSSRRLSDPETTTATLLPTCPPMTTIEGSMSHRLGRLLSPPATSPSVVAAACRRLTSVRTDCIPSDAILS